MNSFRITVDLAGLKAQLAADAQAMGEAARPAAQAGAQVLYDEVKRNVASRKGKTGNLARSIYQAYSADNSVQGGQATYHVSWNHVRAPHGRLVEFGYLQRYKVGFNPRTGRFFTDKTRPLAVPRQIPARPFLRPVLASKGANAQQAMIDRYLAELQHRGVIR